VILIYSVQNRMADLTVEGPAMQEHITRLRP
jgi:hypothetical protein